MKQHLADLVLSFGAEPEVTLPEPKNPERDAIEEGVQQVYREIRDALRLVLTATHPRQFNGNATILASLDDAIENNWDDLVNTYIASYEKHKNAPDIS